MNTQHGLFHWNELMTHDLKRTKEFYATTLGWTFEGMPMPEGTYWLASADGRPAGGLFEMTGPAFQNIPEHWLAYVSVDDVDTRVATALKNGASAIRTPFDIPDVGRIAILHAPGGAAIGLITPVAR